MSQSILALDLGAHTGWAVQSPLGRNERRLDFGIWHNPYKHGQFPGSFLNALYAWLVEMQNWHKPDVVLSCRTFAPGMAGVSLAKQTGVVQMWAAKHSAEQALDVPERTVKKWIAGNGNAPKDDVVAAVNKRLGLTVTDDNEADAIALLLYYMEKES